MDDASLESYADALFGGEDAILTSMREDALAAGLPAIQVPPELGRLLKLLIVASGAERVLEIGTLFGYSTVLMARALPPGGSIVTLELNPVHAELARHNLERAGVNQVVTVLEGNALESLAGLTGQTFDFVFIDADKDTYPQYLEWALRLTASGSVIVADNVWRGGAAARREGPDGQAVDTLNRAVAADSRLTATLVPARSGADAALVAIVQ